MTDTPSELDPEWLRRLRARLDAPPTRPRVPLELVAAGRFEIGTVEPALAERLAHAGLARVYADACRIEVAGGAAGEAAIDAALADIARWLRAEGLAGAWRDERLAVVDPTGRAIGRIERAAVRPLGIATHAVHLVVCDPDRQVWVQQRAWNKSTDPGLWDTAVGGLIAADESVQLALARETWEEAGLRTSELSGLQSFGEATVRRPLNDGYMVEHITMVGAVLASDRVPENQDGEVAGFERLARAALVERLHGDAFTLEAALILARWLATTPGCPAPP
jgi:8-oxo-dGTP pyrophosphatase MutT (NUDIX family)